MSNDNHDDSVRYLPGGAISLTIGGGRADEPAATPAVPSGGQGVATGGVTRVNTHTDEVTQDGGVVRLNYNADNEATPPGDILASAELQGVRVSGPSLLKRGVTVRDPSTGIRTDLKTAARMGLIGQDAAGNFHNLTTPVNLAAQEQAEQERAAAAQAEQVENSRLLPEFEQRFEAATANVSPGVMAEAVHSMIKDGVVDEAKINTMAQQSGKTPEEVMELAGEYSVHLRGKAEAAVEAAGVGGEFDQVVAWAQVHAKAEFQAAQTKLAHLRDATGFRALADRYMRSVVPSKEWLESSGYTTFMRGGVLMVNTPQGPISAAALAKMGAIKRK